MEKMNQVSVSEFFAKSKEEMYDMAVDMVERYNRLIDICNDSCERIAKLVTERDNLSKGVQKLIGERDELIERHSVYTSALNKDIADKAAKIDLLEKEIEGRKEGYVALKELMDTKYISIEEHNNIVDPLNKENERLNIYTANQKKVNHYLVTRVALLEPEIDNLKKELDAREKEIMELNIKIRHQRENLDGINKTLEIRTKENESLIKVRNNLNKEIEAHESENARLTEKITSLNGTITELSHEIDNYKSWNADLHKDIKSEINNKNDLVDAYEKKYYEFEKKIAELESQNEYLTKELNESYKAWDTDSKNHKKRDMTLVDELGKKNDEIKKLKEENSRLSGQVDTDFINKLIQEADYYKNQERIRTDQLRATESKVEELHKSINRLTIHCRVKNEEIEKLKKGGDDNGKSGFKRYIEHLIEEEERAVPERFKERLNKEITEIFTKEEETEVKGNGRTSSGRYPWGAKVNDIPCGEDAIE